MLKLHSMVLSKTAALESIGIDISAGEKNDKKARQEEAGMKAGYWFDGSVPRLGFKTDKELEAEETESRADASFWEGMEYERLKDPIKLFYCPIIESRSECDLGARLAYTEAARLFGRCLDLDKTHIPYYAKRCAALCKLHMFPRALSDAESYISLRPASPTGHCLKGVVYDGLNKYNESIASLEKALERAEIIPYDSSRVWSVGTLVSDNLRRAIERREKVADRASVANQHGVKWRKLGEFGRAVPCLVEALQLQKDCVGNMHLHYATCLNNLGSCLEAMGNYEDAMKHYKDSLAVSEMASPGTLRVMVCAARHLPHVMKGGELQMIDGKLEWVEQGESCDTYVEVELVEELHLGSMSRSKPARTKVAKKNYQPTWNQMLTIQSERGDRSVVVRLMGRNPQRFALEEAAAQKRKQIQGLCMTLLRPSKRASVAQCLLLHTIACIGPAEIDKGREEGWRRECVCICAPVCVYVCIRFSVHVGGR
jgi:tetratricopeptide (TPR) repeat protein